MTSASRPSDPTVTELQIVDLADSGQVQLNLMTLGDQQSTVTIPFDLPSSVEVKLTLYNLTGQRVITLARGMREAGGYSIGWDGMDDAGRALVSGMYFYNLTAGDRSETRKLILLR